MKTVADSSSLIGLHGIHRLNLLQQLFGRILIPRAVALEVQRFQLPQWIDVQEASKPTDMQPFRTNLGRGETESIWLCLQVRADQLIMDDDDARNEARRHEILVTGTLGILLRAKKQGLLSSVRNEMNALRAATFHISPQVYRQVLVRASED